MNGLASVARGTGRSVPFFHKISDGVRYNSRVPPMRYLSGDAQHIGSRHYQQDCYGFSDAGDLKFIEHGGFLAVLCDGMGGMERGDLASQAAVRAFLDAYALKTISQPSRFPTPWNVASRKPTAAWSP